jgi:hypothetical protein
MDQGVATALAALIASVTTIVVALIARGPKHIIFRPREHNDPWAKTEPDRAPKRSQSTSSLSERVAMIIGCVTGGIIAIVAIVFDLLILLVWTFFPAFIFVPIYLMWLGLMRLRERRPD